MGINISGWIAEQRSPDQFMLFKREAGIAAKQTQFQFMEFVQLGAFGKTLLLDSAVMSTQADEFLYHENLVHPAMITHPHPKRVLVVGGAEGATVREILKHPTVEKVVMADIDGELVEFCKENLQEWHQGCLSDPRVTVLYEDGRAYLQQTTETFDVIMMDLIDAIEEGPALALYTQEFYHLCQQRLSPDGVVSLQAFELTPLLWAEHATIARTLRSVFPVVQSYTTYMPAFASTWGFLIATNQVDPAQLAADLIQQRLNDRHLSDKLRAYDAIAHAGLFGLPKELRENIAKSGDILTDA
jgi:spermidine synthase